MVTVCHQGPYLGIRDTVRVWRSIDVCYTTAGDIEDILGSLPNYPIETQAWEDYRPAAADPQTMGAAAANAAPGVRLHVVGCMS